MLPTYNKPRIVVDLLPEFKTLTLSGPTESISSIFVQITSMLRSRREKACESPFLSCAPSVSITQEKSKRNDKESILDICGEWQVFNQVFKEYGIKVPSDQVDNVEAAKQTQKASLPPT